MQDHDSPVYRLTLGRVIASLRKEAGLGQETFAADIGVSQPTLSRIERGEAATDSETFRRVAARVGRSAGELHDLVDDALHRAEQAAAGATHGIPGTGSVWGTALAVAGAVGIAGLVAFAVAAALTEQRSEVRKAGSTRRSRVRRA